MKIAIVGSGVSGLVCAHYLDRAHDVHLFETEPRPGGHTHTFTVEHPAGPRWIDTGFIVFNDWTYPNFIRFLDELGVESQPSSMSFSVRVESNGLEYNGMDLNRLFIQRRNLLSPGFYRMIADILRFNKESPQLLESPGPGPTLGDYLRTSRYSERFINHYIVPMGSAVWSAGTAEMNHFPAKTFVRFFKNHGMLSVDKRPLWRVVKGGSRTYVDRLMPRLRDRVHLRSSVTALERFKDGVRLWIGADPTPQEFDQVVLACHSDQALALLKDGRPEEREVLGAIRYQENETVLHTDTSVLPRNRGAWASWNYWVPASPQDRVAVTYNMNILQGLKHDETYNVSLNMTSRIDPQKILRKLIYHHPIYNHAMVNAQARWGEISGVTHRTHYAGAYWGYGFHEDGVNSGLRVCQAFGVTP